MGHGTWIFTTFPVYGWLLSASAMLLFCSWSLHNVIAWMKNRPFLSRRVSAFYIGTVILVQPYWIVELYSIFCFFNNIGNTEMFLKIRPLEPLFRYEPTLYSLLKQRMAEADLAVTHSGCLPPVRYYTSSRKNTTLA